MPGKMRIETETESESFPKGTKASGPMELTVRAFRVSSTTVT